MGILKKIISSRPTEIESAKKIIPVGNSRPDGPCPHTDRHAGPTPPYGLHHWRDPYGLWHCTECDPPASLAFVREQLLVAADGTLEDELLSPSGIFTAGQEFPPHARGRWRYSADRAGQHWERLAS